MISCPGCGLRHPDRGLAPPDRFHASGECAQLFSDLSCYTVSRQDPAFIHQHAVDAYEAQHAGGGTKPITVVFGLVGLYLALEKGYDGRQVQRVHMQIARVRKDWPQLEPPEQCAAITVADVLRAAPGACRDAMIREWMAAVWEIWADRQEWVRETIEGLVQSRRIGRPRKHAEGRDSSRVR